MNNATSQYRRFTRSDLLDFGEDDGERQALAWDRLRRVCQELHLNPPTRAEVLGADWEFKGEMLDGLMEHLGQPKPFDEELVSIVICHNKEGVPAFVQFAAGYVFGRGVEPSPRGDQARGSETV